jgi:hypothetical protein
MLLVGETATPSQLRENVGDLGDGDSSEAVQLAVIARTSDETISARER